MQDNILLGLAGLATDISTLFDLIIVISFQAMLLWNLN